MKTLLLTQATKIQIGQSWKKWKPLAIAISNYSHELNAVQSSTSAAAGRTFETEINSKRRRFATFDRIYKEEQEVGRKTLGNRSRTRPSDMTWLVYVSYTYQPKSNGKL